MSYYTPLWECHFDVNVYPRSQAPPQETAREPGRSDHMPCDVLCVVLITELLPMQSVLSIISSIQVLLELWTLLTQIGTRRLVRCYLAGKLPISSSRLPPHFNFLGREPTLASSHASDHLCWKLQPEVFWYRGFSKTARSYSRSFMLKIAVLVSTLVRG